MGHYLVYVRRSYRRATDAEVSDELQAERAIALLPPGATHEVIADSGGHRSGRTDRRPGWQLLISRIAEGGIAGVAVYDLSRLSRNARMLLELKAALDVADVPLLVASMPGTRWSTAEGRFLLTILAGAAQLQADIDAKRMTDMMRSVFEAGGHRGLDPFGYRSQNASKGNNRGHVRQLDVVPVEADTVRLVFDLLAQHSTQETARILNRDAVRHRTDRPWTHSAVKDLWRRGRIYLGLAVTRRSGEERPGRHPAIITEEQWEAAARAMTRRRRAGAPVRPHRTYVLSGLLLCRCGRTMAGSATASRGREWRYYRCRECGARGDAEPLEQSVVEAIATMRTPPDAIAYLRAELKRDLAIPVDDGVRRRLEQRRDRLGELYAWGDLDAGAYRAQRAGVEREIAALPTGDRLLLFDRNRAMFDTLADAIADAYPKQLRELVPMLVEWARIDGSIGWTGPAAPFFGAATWAAKPPGGSGDPLAQLLRWYIAA